MKRKLGLSMAFVIILNLAAVFMTLLPTNVAVAASATLLADNFNGYANIAAMQAAGWTTTGSPVLAATAAPANLQYFTTTENSSAAKTFAPVALTAAGGASPGSNAQLIVTFDAHTSGGSGSTQSYWWVDDSATGNVAVSAGRRAGYGTPVFYAKTIGGSFSGITISSGLSRFTPMKFVIKITDAAGAFLSGGPKVDIYCGSMSAPVSGGTNVSMIDAGTTRVNRFYIGGSYSSHEVDNLNITLQTGSEPTPTPTPAPTSSPSLTTLMSDNFNGYANIAAMQAAGWTTTGSPVLAATAVPANLQYFTTTANSSAAKTFAPVALTAAGGASPGSNAQLIVTFDAHTSGGSGSTQSYWWVDDSVTGNVAVSAGRRAGYGTPVFYAKTIGGSFSGITISSGLSRFTPMKFVIKITDAAGAFLSGGPKVDIYCGSMSAPVSGGTNVSMIDTGTTRVNRFYIGGSYSSHEIDNLSITLQTSSDGTPTATPTPAPTPTATPSTSLSISDVRTVSTFHSMSVYATYSNANGTPNCNIRYRVSGTGAWMDGQKLWTDTANSEFRGSIVYLQPGTSYDIQLIYSDDTGSGTHQLTQSTWSETFPQGAVTTITNQSTALNITQSGTPGAYRVYSGPTGSLGVINVQKNAENCIVIDASYVIVRGLNVTGATKNAIVIAPNAHDVIIEDCTITNWGPSGPGRDASGVHYDWAEASAIYSGYTDPDTAELGSQRLIIQNNKIGPATGTAGGWEYGHTTGPQGISICQSRGNNVIRYNEVIGNEDHQYNDCIGGALNHNSGNVNRDSDIYGNICDSSLDDAIEVEGWNINVRVWNNFTENSWRGIATAQTANDLRGPLYVFRNIFNSNGDGTGVATKLLGQGPLYFYHNMLGTPDSYMESGIHPTVRDGSIRNLTTRNNIFFINSSHEGGPFSKDWRYYQGNTPNSLDYDHFVYDCRTDFAFDPDDETHGIFSAPTLSLTGTFNYYHTAGSNGYNAAFPLPGFNHQYNGAGPDTGACEQGTYEFIAGVQT